MIKVIKSKSSEFISDSTIHALPNILRTDNFFFKIVWLLCFLVMSAFCIFLLARSVKSFFEFDVVTQIKEWNKNPLEFPAVSFCNLNKLNKNYTLNETLIVCEFNGLTCNENDFTSFYDLKYGICYRFNTNGSRSSNKPGSVNGLLIFYFIGKPDDISPVSLSTSNGVHIYVHNQSSIPTISEGIDLPSHYQTNVMIKQTFTSRLAEPYNHCDENPSYFNSSVFNNYTAIYRQKDCFDLKFLEEFARKCNYSGNINEIQKQFNLRIFQDPSANGCLTSTYISFYNVDQSINLKYSADCPLECNSQQYTTSLSMSKFPSKSIYNSHSNKSQLIKLFNGNFSIDEYTESIVTFRVFYETLSFTEISQSVKTDWIDFISNVGGIFGLCLGMSLLSVVEMFQVLIEILLILIR